MRAPAATLTFKRRPGLVVHALDAAGALGAEIPVRRTAAGTVLTLGPAGKTCFFGVEAR